MELVQSVVSPAAAICVLGPGNCNDLDLRDLILGGDTLQLADLDIVAVGKACSRAGIRDCESTDVGQSVACVTESYQVSESE